MNQKDLEARADRAVRTYEEWSAEWDERLAERKRAHLRRLRIELAIPALVGLVVVLWQITRENPSDLYVVLGALLMVPLLATWTGGTSERTPWFGPDQ
jgi:hypothetical protein